MRKIYLFRTPQNKVGWTHTRAMIIDYYPNFFSDGMFDYGAGAEHFAACPGCNRKLPLVLFHLDHILSRSRYAVSNMGMMANDRFVIIDSDCDRAGTDTTASALGGIVTISSGPMFNRKIGLSQAKDVWENDLRNLQFLCGHCNTSKKDKDWIEWGKAAETARPLSACWKHTIPSD